MMKKIGEMYAQIREPMSYISSDIDAVRYESKIYESLYSPKPRYKMGGRR